MDKAASGSPLLFGNNDTDLKTANVSFPKSNTISINNYTVCLSSEAFLSYQYTMDDLFLGASIGATVFNILVIVCAMKLFKKSGDTMHLFIISMTCGDFLLTGKHDFLKTQSLCTIIHYFNWTGLAVSGLSLTMLNIDKLIYFRWPMSYDTTMSKRRAGFICCMIWVLSMFYCLYIWLTKRVAVNTECILVLTHRAGYHYEFFMLVFCVLPVSSSLVVSIYLFRLTRQKRCAPMCVGTNTDAPTFKRKAKSLVFIFATTMWTSFSLLPYRMFNFSRKHFFDWSELPCDVRENTNWLAWFLVYLLTANPIVNPLITAIIYAPYRRAIKRLFFQLPGGNRFQYTSCRAENTDTSFLSFRRSRSRSRFSGSVDNDSNYAKKNQSQDVRISLNSFDTSSGGEGGKIMMSVLNNRNKNGSNDRNSLIISSTLSSLDKDKPFRNSTSAFHLPQNSSRPSSGGSYQNNQQTTTSENAAKL